MFSIMSARQQLGIQRESQTKVNLWNASYREIVWHLFDEPFFHSRFSLLIGGMIQVKCHENIARNVTQPITSNE